jgi:DNA-directed RNA polymerase specialized sigma24 family protein
MVVFGAAQDNRTDFCIIIRGFWEEMADKTARKVPEERAATLAEVEAAIAALSDPDLYRLREFAERREFMLQEKARGRDLLGEAFERLLRGSRKWDKTKIGFLAFLYGAMRSIAYSWLNEKTSPVEAPLIASALVVEDDEGKLSDPVADFARPAADASALLVYLETFEQIDLLFADDEEVRMVIEGFREGLDPPAIRDLWGFSQPKYNAIIIRMRRKMRRAGIADPRGVSRYVQ